MCDNFMINAAFTIFSNKCWIRSNIIFELLDYFYSFPSFSCVIHVVETLQINLVPRFVKGTVMQIIL